MAREPILLEAKVGRRFTPAERALVDAGKAFIARCEICQSEWVACAVPADLTDVVKSARLMRCPNAPPGVVHRMMWGPL